MLEVENLQVVYGNSIEALRNASFQVGKGSITALLGSNGAGKSTILKSISGVLYPEDGKIRSGGLSFEGLDLTNLMPNEIVRLGIAHVPEGRRLFIELTVEENLIVGGYTRSRAENAATIEEIYTLFPRLKEKRSAVSGYLSGGEQQMVAIGRALMKRPRLLMLDEPSLGIAPIIVADIYQGIRELNSKLGLTVLLVEQDASLALKAAQYAYVMENGRVVLDGTPEALSQNEDVREFYLGVGERGDRRSMREVKHYRRRKRWLS
ncbi:ABC transporter ATP-binding protein [Mesorhizobium sp. ANAO-SY3R2]|uniref:ABC transporter ATP-binding protein n=1 Tax=Mesorhizobium sp. ANAO-SY3R2 TaxID=3166644 RepID=UPI003671F1CE